MGALLHDPRHDTVLLVRQFRLPAFLNEADGFLIEAPAGLLEGIDPGERMRRELEEETGYAVSQLTKVFDCFMSPGSVTERLMLFTGRYDRDSPVSDGGGAPDEGEDIEILHIPFANAMEQVRTGVIADAKTILLLQHLALSRA